ncbi:MAG: aminotransferase class I/II-fold pyridoxal phosphate-dependent enzyme, partial [Candidatus Solibacter usitatus]|nr:aminotransferase class I/II-fold pyridoxal phosphate-dependent enzyme [Candidatus Solibacter usitatus]
MDAARFAFTREEMIEAGHEAVEQVARHVDDLRELPALETASREEMEALIGELPRQGRPLGDVLREASEVILRYRARPAHPRFFAFVPGVGNYAGALADFLAHGHNVFAGSWMEAAGPSMVEVRLLDWLKDVVGYPAQAGGVFVSGGSMANLTALAAARDTMLGEELFPDGVVYLSDQTHSSVARALRLLGFRKDQIRTLVSDEDCRLALTPLQEMMRQDRAAGRRPFCIVANAGTTNTGAVDPLDALADLCREHTLWLHIDGSYGAAAALCDEGRNALRGMERADSIALDPHKWLFAPFACGCVLARDAMHLARTFHMRPEYLEDMGGSNREPNFWDYGPELTRPFRALKLWVALQTVGLDACRAAMENGFHLARVAGEHVSGMRDWEVITPAQMGMVSFRYAPAGWEEAARDRCNRETGLAFTRSGRGFIISTVVKGRTVLRMCTINPRSTEVDV